MKRMRDSQRSKIYAAEMHGLVMQSVKANESLSLRETQAWLDKIIKSRSFVKRYFPKGGLPIGVDLRDGRGRRRGCARGRIWDVVTMPQIVLPVFARRRYYILHELAHLCAPKYDTDKDGRRAFAAPHSWQFAAEYLWLVGRYIRASDRELLKAAFRKNKVKFTKPRAKRVLTPEQREALVERLAKARAVKVARREAAGGAK